MLDGVQHIHAQGLAHGDLHDGNVMISSSQVKIIDILYLDTLERLSGTSRELRRQKDISDMRFLLAGVLENIKEGKARYHRYMSAEGAGADLATLRQGFDLATGKDSHRFAGQSLMFVDDDAYDVPDNLSRVSR